MTEVETVSGGIDQWLRAEIRESGEGRNQFLDDYLQFREGIALPQDHQDNVDARKSAAHHNRFDLLMRNVTVEDMQNDFLTGKIIHHALMFVSGGFRTQCFLQSADNVEYRERRFGSDEQVPVGTSLSLETEVGFDWVAVHEQLLDLDPARLLEESAHLNDQIHDAHLDIYRWFADHPERYLEALEEDELPVESAKSCQELGLYIAVAHIAVAANLRGDDLSKVPFLEPKSISDVSQQPIYPLTM